MRREEIFFFFFQSALQVDYALAGVNPRAKLSWIRRL
jgi:hypothetical protein